MEEEILNLLNIKKEDLVGEWEAQESDVQESTMSKRRGFLLLTRNELIFVSKGGGIFARKPKECWRVPLSTIKSIGRIPLFNVITISYNVAPEKAGFLRKFTGMRQLAFKVRDSKLFIQKLKELNPNIK